MIGEGAVNICVSFADLPMVKYLDILSNKLDVCKMSFCTHFGNM